MLYNLRSDIIYYKSNSDFEMEFNLCGCCRMRLLTDKSSNKKAFVHSLARAVSRSRVILIAGPLFGEENTVEIVAKALGTETEIADNSVYNIKSEDEIEIIKGSLPLVSADGSYGGCIIESGPQTMILLTDNKTLRKSIMTNLIHPYISELYEAESGPNKATPENVTAEPEAEETPVVDEIPLDDETPADEEASPLIANTDESLVEEAETPQEQAADASDEKLNSVFENIPDDEPTLVTNTDTAEKSDDVNLVLDTDEKEASVLTPEEINAANQLVFDDEYEMNNLDNKLQDDFNSLIFDNEPITKNNHNSTINIAPEYHLFDDEGNTVNRNDIPSDSRLPSFFNLATIIITAILLLAIIVLCYCIFAVAGKEGVAPAEYIKTVWNTVFG